ncbi:MAG: CARDB domain-containing protein, partial [Verrucomicrobiota bacterium]
MIGVGQKIQIRANIRNYGEGTYKDLRVYFKVDGKDSSVSQVPILNPHEKRQLLFSHAFPTAGSHVVEVVADADPLKSDNVFLASIPVRDKMPVLLVNGDPSNEPLKGETDFAEIALQPYTAGRVELADLISTRVIRPDELDPNRLAESAVVVLANVRTLNEAQLRGLEEFVKNGGGLLVFTGNRVDQGWYNGPFFKEGKGLLPMALGALAGDANAPSVSIVSQRFENPALELFNEARNGTLSESAIRIWFKLREPEAAPGSGVPSTLARLANGDPFLVGKAFGEGHVIACSTAIDSDWSNLPTRSTYVPLLQRLVVYLASTIYPSRNLDVGKPIVALFPPGDAGKKAVLTNPGGVTHELPIAKKGGRGVVEFGRTGEPGLYTLAGPAAAPIHYVVNAARRESVAVGYTGSGRK